MEKDAYEHGHRDCNRTRCLPYCFTCSLYAMKITGVGGFGGPSCNPPSSFLRVGPTQAAQAVLTTAVFPASFVPTAFAQTQISVASSIPNTNPAGTGTGAPGAIRRGLLPIRFTSERDHCVRGVVYGGIPRFGIGAGNPSRQSEGREWIESALIGILSPCGGILNFADCELRCLILRYRRFQASVSLERVEEVALLPLAVQVASAIPCRIVQIVPM